MLPDPEYAVRKAGELKVQGECCSGAAECDVEVPETGWYELLAQPEGGLNESVVDGRLSLFAWDRREEGAHELRELHLPAAELARGAGLSGDLPPDARSGPAGR